MRGYKEEETTTTPFDMAMRIDIDRFHLAGDVIDRAQSLLSVGAHTKQRVRDNIVEH